MRRVLCATATMLFLGACTVSVTGPKEVLMAGGEPVTVALRSEATLEGELLAVRDTDLVLKEQQTLVAVAIPAVRDVSVVRYELTVREHLKETLSLYSRYPQGLSDEQWRLLLREAGQDEFARIDDPLSTQPKGTNR